MPPVRLGHTPFVTSGSCHILVELGRTSVCECDIWSQLSPIHNRKVGDVRLAAIATALRHLVGYSLATTCSRRPTFQVLSEGERVSEVVL